MNVLKQGACVLALTMASGTMAKPTRVAVPAELPAEPTPSVAVLADHYPASYVLVHDIHSPSILDGRLAVIDVSSAERAYSAVSCRSAQTEP